MKNIKVMEAHPNNLHKLNIHLITYETMKRIVLLELAASLKSNFVSPYGIVLVVLFLLHLNM